MGLCSAKHRAPLTLTPLPCSVLSPLSLGSFGAVPKSRGSWGSSPYWLRDLSAPLPPPSPVKGGGEAPAPARGCPEDQFTCTESGHWRPDKHQQFPSRGCRVSARTAFPGPRAGEASPAPPAPGGSPAAASRCGLARASVLSHSGRPSPRLRSHPNLPGKAAPRPAGALGRGHSLLVAGRGALAPLPRGFPRQPARGSQSEGDGLRRSHVT